MPQIVGANVTLMVSDMDVAIKFYTEVLGLKLKNRYGNHWADVEGPGIAIGLHPASAEVKKGDNIQIGLKVNELDKVVAELTAKNVELKVKDDTQVKLAFFTDPDGNTLYLSESKW